MVSPVPTPFNVQSGAIASYSYSDLLQQASYQIYYGGSVNNSYVLNPQAFASTAVMTEDSANNSSKAGTPDFDLDFDLTEFEVSQSMKGIAIVTVPFNVNITGGATETNNIEIQAYIRKWDGSTETEIANSTSGTVSVTTASTGVRNGVATIFVDVPRTFFAAGETLRVTIHAYYWHNQNYSIAWQLGHSPDGSIGDDFRSSRFSSGDNVIMSVQIPYEVDR